MMGIRYEPAECDPCCNVPDCPYFHSPGWWVGAVSFATKQEAEEYLAKRIAEAAKRDRLNIEK